MSLSSVVALTFDVFGTVVDWRFSIAREGAALGRDKGIDLDWLAFADEWRALYQQAMERVRSGEIAWCKLDALHRINLGELLTRHSIGGLTEGEALSALPFGVSPARAQSAFASVLRRRRSTISESIRFC